MGGSGGLAAGLTILLLDLRGDRPSHYTLIKSLWRDACRGFFTGGSVKKNLLALLLFAGGTVFGAIGVGITIGPPPPPRVIAVPASPGPGYTWIAGYWYPVDGRYVWHEGYWSRPPFGGAVWVAPHHDGHAFFNGYWEGGGRRVEHDHHWDHDHDRDFRR
jgi:hypothetical protein